MYNMEDHVNSCDSLLDIGDNVANGVCTGLERFLDTSMGALECCSIESFRWQRRWVVKEALKWCNLGLA
jgi:hypothetical protein